MSIRHSHRAGFVLGLVAALALAAPAPGATPTFTLYVPTSASIHGNAGAFFHTDLWVFNRSFDSSLSVTATYRCFVGSCSSASSTFVLSPRESRLYPDVDAALFGEAETAGAIELSYTHATDDLAATTRTYTPTLPLPTNGTAIPALTLADARTRALFLGLGSNGGNLTSGFRSNAGAYNPGPSSAVVTYTLFQPNGTLIGTASQALSAAAAGQINDIFNAAGAGSTVTTNAVLVVTSTAPVFPFVTVIDNQSGDSVYAAPSSDLPAAPSASLIANGGFDTGLGSWTNPAPDFITMAFTPTDAAGDPRSGTMLVTNTDTTPNGGGNGPLQCVPLTPGTLLNISVRMRVPSGQSGTATVTPQLFLYASGNCTGNRTNDGFGLPGPSQFDTWETKTATATVPAAVHSAEFRAFVVKISVAGTFAVYFDDVSMVSSAR